MSSVIIKPEHQSAPKDGTKVKERWDKTNPRHDPHRKKAEQFSKKWWKENEHKMTASQKKEMIDRYNNNPNDLPGLVPMGGKGKISSTYSHIPTEKWDKIFNKE